MGERESECGEEKEFVRVNEGDGEKELVRRG